MVAIGIEHPGIRFEIVYGASGNRRSWYDNSNAHRFQGGTFVSAERGGDPAKPVN